MFSIEISETKKKILLHLLIILLFASILRIPTFSLSVIDWDETAYALVAREILMGNWPYSSTFDHKPIGLYLHFALIMSIAGDNPTASRILSFILVLFSSLILKSLLQERLNVSAIRSTLFALLFLLMCSGLGGISSNSEHVVNFYVLLWCWSTFNALYSSKKYFFLSGALMGIAFQSNYLSVVIIIGFYVGLIFYAVTIFNNSKDSLKLISSATILGLLGFIFTVSILLLPIIMWGNIDQYFELQTRFLSGYLPKQGSLIRLSNLLGILSSFIIVIIFLVYKSFMRKKEITNLKNIAENYLFAFLLIGSIVATSASGRFYGHYFLFNLPTVLLFVSCLFRTASLSKDAYVLIFLIMFTTGIVTGVHGVFYAVKGGIDSVRTLTDRQLKYDTPRIIANNIKQYISLNEKIYVVCAQPVIYQLLETTPPTRYPFYIHHFDKSYAKAFGFKVRDKVSEILDKEPAVIVLGQFEKCTNSIKLENWEWLRTQIKLKKYQHVNTINQNMIFIAAPKKH
ncbi:MAG: glycosyltransferase family 39 protein [Hyphomicrobiales bacterium]